MVAGIALAGALVLTSCATPVAAPVPGDDIGTRLDFPLPASLAALPFRTSEGRTVTLGSLRGKVVVLSDVMTLCQETCPIDTAALVETARETDTSTAGSDVVFLSLTVDPQRDTPSQLAAYRKLFTRPPTNWLALTGPPAEVDALWDYLGVWRQKVAEPAGPAPTSWRTGAPLTYDIEHSDEVFFLDQAGHERFILEGAPHVTDSQVPATLHGFLDADGRNTLATPAAGSWTVAQARETISWLNGQVG